ncbi:Uncharacterised protein [Serratia marcescens]|uniref:ead/Ea22-like family protein n=1 Tax=Serratia marcescens TaxID=615 RepID=UPI0007451CF2|nr:ead/Ea22-like family protein [Serratia marcescens]CUZ88206.1 Uncharacterised protein [Serratia marcescens]CVA50561.1 Uncharacterised protein [Serratia marcescens]CVA76990.1 Uncharacterised protein [Serratia marcescens]CVH15706.1 Uncharacterised protein [Serratia marcescens]
MDNKLSELKRRADKCPIKRFKAFIGKANTQATLCADTGIEIIGWSGFDASDLNAKSHRVELARFIAAADPETILALLAELEAKDKRIAELEQVPTIKHMRSVEESLIRATDMVSELEKRLATPVRLQSPWVDKVGNRWLLEGTTADVIRVAGFAVTIEGDE